MRKTTKRKPRKKKVSVEHLFRLLVPTSVSISNDEKRIVYTVERIDTKDNKYYTNIHMCDIAGGKSRQFTHGKQADGKPVWSPDDSHLAFVSTRDKKTGIYLMPSEGGAERKLIELDGSIANLQWTPDGKNLVFALRNNDSNFIKDEEKKKEPPVYRHITRFWYRLDGEGFLPKDKFQIYTLIVESGKMRQITGGKRDNTNPSVSPDGKWITYVSNRSKDPDIEFLKESLFMVPFEGGEEKEVPTPLGPKSAPRFSPDGKLIAYIGHDNPNDAWGVTNARIWVVGVNNRPQAHDILPTFDRHAYDSMIADLSDAHDPGALYWSADGKRIYFAASDTGVTNLFYVPARGGKPTRFFKGKCHVKGFSMAGKKRTVALIYSDLNNPGDIMSSPTTFGAEKKAVRHTDLNPWLRSEVQLAKTREVWFKAYDGTEIQGWLVTPPNFKPTRKYPAILEIHGGPRAQYGHSFFHEMQYLAAQGYVVFYTNPRGGAGRGETFAGCIVGDWGGFDYQDCMAAADYMEDLKYVDPKRTGVTGGSYGGYMTNWIVGQTDRFAAAVTQRSISNLVSFVGSSDIGFDLEMEFQGWPWTNPANYEKCSPITYFGNVKTPVLIIHSEQDLRCPIEQAEQMFAMLKLLGKKVEMVRFPEEPHGLSRHGRPDRRKARLEWIVKWFDQYLKK
ncbi:MAG: S9 family peptidase [Candidatus Zixiibacteriota bacterium]|jgi:dipeptidyl aminopeptidase/acylaminoacyl peptidase